MTSSALGLELDELRSEYNSVEKMSEEVFHIEYNTDDSKSEFLSYLQEEINDLQDRYDESEAEENRDWRTAGLDPAFSSWEDVNRMFV